MDKNRIKLTEQGEEKVEDFINDLEIRRSELIHAGLADEDDETFIPDVSDIICDIAVFIDDEEDDYFNGWNATDNDEPRLLELKNGEDFIVKGELEAVCG